MIKQKEDPFAAEVLANGRHIFVKTYSGIGLVKADPLGVNATLPADVDDQELGATVLKALSMSRHEIDAEEREEARRTWPNTPAQRRYDAWVERAVRELGYGTKRKLFKNMASCMINLYRDVLQIDPSNHVKLEAWSGDGITDADRVRIAPDSGPVEVGKAVRLALSRCL